MSGHFDTFEAVQVPTLGMEGNPESLAARVDTMAMWRGVSTDSIEVIGHCPTWQGDNDLDIYTDAPRIKVWFASSVVPWAAAAVKLPVETAQAWVDEFCLGGLWFVDYWKELS